MRQGKQPASTNFGFLTVHDPRLAVLGAQAERYFREDPATTIIKLRQLAELLAKLVAAHHARYLGDWETFEEALRRWIDRLAKETASSHKLVDQLDQAVLAKAFRGELAPQNPNDEPASVLLERIEAERADATPERRQGRRQRVG